MHFTTKHWGSTVLSLALAGCAEDAEDGAAADGGTTTGASSSGSANTTADTSGDGPTDDDSSSTGTSTGDAFDDVPRFEPGDCRVDVPEGVELECGDLIVAQDRLDPEAGTIALHVVRFLSANPEAAADPMVVLTGGPGQPMAGLVAGLPAPVVEILTAERDVIFYDQRGVGASLPALTCDGIDTSTDDPAEQLAAVAACRDDLVDRGIVLHAFRTVESADDLDDMRVALGVPALNVFGTSYGTRLGLEVLRRHPETTRSAVLDSQVPADLPWPVHVGANFDAALTAVFAACDGDDACSAAYPDLEAAFSGAVARFDAEPLMFPGGTLSGSDVVALLFQGMYDTTFIPVVPQVVETLRSGTTDEIEAILGEMGMRRGAPETTPGMHLAVLCNDVVRYLEAADAYATVTDAGLRPEVETWALQNLATYVDGCEGWPTVDSGPDFLEPVSSDVPTLLTGGEFDPVTPMVWSERVAETLSAAQVVAFATHGHGPLVESECGLSLLLGHIGDPSATLDAACAEDFSIEFVLR